MWPGGGRAAMSDSPNLVFIWTDQQAYNTLGAYGNDRIETPNLDALAQRGRTFERAYCTSPVCGPSRSSVMTGKYSHTTGITGNNIPLAPDDRTFAELVPDEYVCGWIGKWHLGDEIFRQRGFDEWVSTEDQYHHFYGKDRPAHAHSDYHDFLLEHGYEPDQNDDGYRWFSREFVACNVPEEHSKPSFMADAALDFIDRHRDEPFVLHVMFLEPHDPYASPRDDQYDPDEVPLPPNNDHAGMAEQPLRYRFAREVIRRGISRRPPDEMGEPPSEDDWREVISRYWGLVSLVDTHVGRILDELDETGLVDDTITVFTSDHGDMMGSHGLYTKMTQFEESVRVPLLLGIPDMTTPGERIEEPVSQIDLVPTLLDAMGLAIPETAGMQGTSWVPELGGGSMNAASPVVIEWNGANFHGAFGRRAVEHPAAGRPGLTPEARALAEEMGLTEADVMTAYTDPARTLVTADGWKYTARRSGEDELYHLGRDPYEQTNELNTHHEIVREKRAMIGNWQVETRDPVYL